MKGKVALITGSAGGMGYAVAARLAAAGCSVVLNGLESAAAVEPQREALAKSHGVPVQYVQADLADPQAIEAMIAGLRSTLGGVDILLNNAVVRHFAPVDEFPVDKWDQAIAVNLSAAFHTIRLCLPGMRKKGWGRIFNMTSVYGQRATPNRIDYVTTKTALIGMTRSVAIEAAAHGITCNAICPGAVHTPGIEARIQGMLDTNGRSRDDTVREFLAGKNPSGRFISADHVGDLVLFLCSQAGGDINGAVLPIEGGWLAG
jgi:3-hydroxybutyrate dehydrogenase